MLGLVSVVYVVVFMNFNRIGIHNIDSGVRMCGTNPSRHVPNQNPHKKLRNTDFGISGGWGDYSMYLDPILLEQCVHVFVQACRHVPLVRFSRCLEDVHMSGLILGVAGLGVGFGVGAWRRLRWASHAVCHALLYGPY